MVAVLGAVGVARGRDVKKRHKVQHGPLGMSTIAVGSHEDAPTPLDSAHLPGDLAPRGGE